MTDPEKQRVAVLRSQGESYKSIAEVLGVPINSVKTFCRRSHLTGIRGTKILSEPTVKNDLIDEENRGNTVTAEAQEIKEKPAVSAPRKSCKVKLVFADAPDEDAIPAVLEMLIKSRMRRG